MEGNPLILQMVLPLNIFNLSFNVSQNNPRKLAFSLGRESTSLYRHGQNVDFQHPSIISRDY